jgi:hypothetical protein
LVGDDRADSFSRIRKAKIPYKIKIFLWLIENNVVLTRDNMLKRKRVGDPTCQFCKENETNDHLFFRCVVAKVIWGIVAQCIGAKNNIGSG